MHIPQIYIYTKVHQLIHVRPQQYQRRPTRPNTKKIPRHPPPQYTSFLSKRNLLFPPVP